MNEYFKIAGDLDDNKIEEQEKNDFFKIAGDLKDNNRIKDHNGIEMLNSSEFHIKVDNTVDNIVDNNAQIHFYLKNIVSGIKYPDECELGYLCGEGNVIVSFSELGEMIDSGEYNIISANYFNPDMIEIKYQQFSKNKKTLF